MSLQRRIGSQIERPADKRRYVRGLFTGISRRYDLMNDVMSLGLHRRWKRRAVQIAEIEPGHRVLDLAAGTGDLGRTAVESAADTEPGEKGETAGTAAVEVVAADLTPAMMRTGRERGGPPLAGWVCADAAALPFPDRSFDRVLIGYGLRNFAELGRCLEEILRCLRPGGRFVSLEMGKPRSAITRAGYLAYLDVSTRVLGWAMLGDAESYAYLPASLRRYPAQDGVRRLMEEAGFVRCGVEDLVLGTMAIHLGERPHD